MEMSERFQIVYERGINLIRLLIIRSLDDNLTEVGARRRFKRQQGSLSLDSAGIASQ